MNKEHTEEQFNEFMSQLTISNTTLSYYCDFDKVTTNVNAIAIKLHQLNYLIGKEDIATAIKELWEENSSVFDVLEILIAVRSQHDKKAIDRSGKLKSLKDFFKTPEGVIEYIEDTGLKDVFSSKRVTNLVDYVFGVEVGLDSNTRKNRGGDIMAKQVAEIFTHNGISFRQEVDSTEFNGLGILGKDKKRFDFVIECKNKTYLIEVNFYNGGGSKLNEVARAYSELAPKINQCPNYEFVWVTDGGGWTSARNKLEEAFYIIPSVYNLSTLKNFIDIIKNDQTILSL